MTKEYKILTPHTSRLKAQKMNKLNIREVLKDRILVLDGAMGSLIQEYKLSDADYRGEQFKDFPHEVKGNNDMLSITRPDVIKEIHAKYFEAGADIAETNTFSGTSIAMADYHMEDYVYQLNYESAKIAREVRMNLRQKIQQNLVMLRVQSDPQIGLYRYHPM